MTPFAMSLSRSCEADSETSSGRCEHDEGEHGLDSYGHSREIMAMATALPLARSRQVTTTMGTMMAGTTTAAGSMMVGTTVARTND